MFLEDNLSNDSKSLQIFADFQDCGLNIFWWMNNLNCIFKENIYCVPQRLILKNIKIIQTEDLAAS